MIEPYFQLHPFRPAAASELEQDARLALHLVLFLLSSQDSATGTWPGLHVGATMRNTCHALEALSLVGREVAAGAVETGLAWLINLPDVYRLGPEEEEALRLYPSRFKTLAWLGEFYNPEVRSDFEELEQHLDSEGFLQGLMPKQLLATMVYVDCLNYMEQLAPLPAPVESRRRRALDCIHQQVLLWYQDQQETTRHSLITTAGDLSYAMDLLFRTERITRQENIGQMMLEVLVAAITQPESQRVVPSDVLYCGVQLALHFPEVGQATEAVRLLLSWVRRKYERLELKKEGPSFHPLVLRVMLAYHGDQLKAEMIRFLLEQERKNLEVRQQNAEQLLKNDFRTLLKDRFKVEITEVQPLTGGLTEAKVFRVHFSLKLATLSEGNETRVETYRPNPGSLVIKSGSLDSLNQSIERYRNLSPAVRPYFARHAGDPQRLEAAPTAPSYLVMEDLTYMDTFHSILNRLDQGALSKPKRVELEKAGEAIFSGLFAIYDQTRQSDIDFFGSQLARLYISRLEKKLVQMCHADKFPHLKTWLRGFWLGERKYPSIEYYLRKLESQKARLKVPHLMLVHGDCHSRNIMLDAQLSQLKLIDLDHLDEDGDYIQDLALLLEDVAVFRFLFIESYRFHLEKEQVKFLSNAPDHPVIENRIDYRAFSSEAVKLFQHSLLRHMDAYARTIQDESARERLWLAMATALMSLIPKQTEKEYATLLYVEAIKLLDDLIHCIDKDVSLPDIPFPGKQPAGVKPAPSRESSALPAWYQENSVLAQVHDELLSLDPLINCQLVSSGRIAQYFVDDFQKPFAVVDGKKTSPSVLLAGSTQVINDPAGMVQERKTESALRLVVQISEQTEVASVLALIRQAFHLSQAQPD